MKTLRQFLCTSMTTEDSFHVPSLTPDDSIHVPSMTPDDSFQVPSMTPDDSFHVLSMTPDESFHVPAMKPDDSFHVPILSLTLIACDRFFGVVFAMKAHIIERKARHSIILVWLFAFAIASPLLVFRTLHQRQWKNHLEQWCDDEWPLVFKHMKYGQPVYHQPARKIYWTTLSVVLFLIPILVMACAYTRIIKTLWAAKTPGERVPKDITVQTRMKRKIVLTLMLIMIVFAVCWVPIQFTILYSEYKPEKHPELEQWYEQLSFFAHVLAFANSSINPMIYAGFNDNFKKGFKQMFGLYKKRYTSVSRLDDSSTTVVTSLSRGRVFKEESSFTLNGKTRDAWNGSAQACSKMAIYEELNNLVCSSSDNGM
ncbi:NPFFR2 [Mytilus coruscus]|uniref:NPFFR2 n=1 Tax=Mytilus coruscus TaxID=42192 RepID=A0A6J8EUJ3_MYTCO|nr:NPFFR2 [Mytilus coruscus]